MNIYLTDDEKLSKYLLPETAEESFLISYKGKSGSDTLIVIEAENGVWKLKSNGNVNVVGKEQVIDEITLSNYGYYFLKILGQTNYIIMYVAPATENPTYKLNYLKFDSIIIGNSQNSNIVYKDPLISEINCQIKKENDEWIISEGSNIKVGVYLNKSRISRAKLNYGDVIFINGLKIIWMPNFLKINNPNNLVGVVNMSAYEEIENFNNKNYVLPSEEETTFDLYKEDDYFFHVPTLKETIETVEFEIDAPPSPEKSEDLPAILTWGTSLTMFGSFFISTYSFSSGLISGTKTVLQVLPQIIISITMLIGGIIIPKITNKYNKKKKADREALRQVKYKKYLETKENEVMMVLKNQSKILLDNYLNVLQCQDLIMQKGRNLWSREIDDNDFLTVRLGIGSKPADIAINAPKEHFTLDEDNLLKDVQSIIDRTKNLNNVPITLSLAKHNILSFICNCTYQDDYINGIIAQLIAYHSANDLKIVILTNEKNASKWEFAKYLPHCQNDQKTMRFFATNSDEVKEVTNYLEEIIKKRKEVLGLTDEKNNKEDGKEDTYKQFLPYFIIINDNYKTIKNNQLLEELFLLKKNLGMTFISLEKTMKDVPNKCKTFIQIGEKDGCVLEKEISSKNQKRFTNEFLKSIDMKKLSKKLLNIPIVIKDEDSILPTSLSFLEMFGLSKIEQFNILNRWKTNNPVINLSTPVGVHTNGEQFKLNLHEKFHGPHGLIAGSTGSGKSEFIITYILSMAINYHPYEVQFVLIDYKGGGLAGAFENKESGVHIPHLAGTITNLDTSEMNRTLVSIESELKRRQKLFSEVKDLLGEGTIDIYKYQRLYREGVVKEPMAHLFIISDEFAELKSQQPDFMAQLITTARIGRSLGVHLILATQKPSGVVNDQIWSNSKFKVCFKVQDRSDSMEMLKKPDAASIKEVGRFFLQVGYDDYFDVGQSGWGGAKYVPTNRIVKKIDDSVSLISNTGITIKNVNDVIKKEVKEDLGDQLTNIVKYIHNLSIKENIKTNKLWLDIIPSQIFINDLKQKYQYKQTHFYINPIIGEYDNPTAQEQGLLTLDLTKGGNTLIWGQSGSGKENLLSTIIWSSIIDHSPEEINYYIIDCGAETLKIFNKAPHIGEIATLDEGEKIVGIFDMISEELEKRKDLMADYAGNYTYYLENSGQKLPLIAVIINNYEIFSENYGNLSEAIQPFFRDCSKYGINFIITASTTNGVRTRTAQQFNNKIVLQLPSDSEYRSLIEAPKGLTPAKYFGRGLVAKDDTAYEFQTAFISEPKVVNNLIREAITKLNQLYAIKAKKIATIPNIVTLDLVKENIKDLTKVPIGFAISTKNIHYYDFKANPVTMILSNEIEEKIDFVYVLIKILLLMPSIKIKVIDFMNIYDNKIKDAIGYKTDFDNVFNAIAGEINNDKNSLTTNFYIILGIGQMKSKLGALGKEISAQIFAKLSTYQNSKFIFFDSYNSYKNIQLEAWYQSQVNNTNGIWLGDGIGSQIAINVPNVSVEDRKINFAYMGFAIEKGKHTIIKCVLDDMGDNNEK